jgi:osmotically inducible protein OsmC
MRRLDTGTKEDEVKRQAFARWEGNLRNGRGVITVDSGALVKAEYSFSGRYERVSGLSPEELLAAAHAACFSMAVAGELNGFAIGPDSIQTNATVEFTRQLERLEITKVELDVHARIPGFDPIDFEKAVKNAREHSPMLALLKDKNKISVSTHLSAL